MVCLVGESASGKSTVERLLVRDYGFQNIVSYTTRKPRKRERDGVDYHFVNDKTFKNMINNNRFAEYTNYNGWWYGIAIEDCKNDRVVVVNPHGLRQMKNNPNLNVISFYIHIPQRDRFIKILQRGDDINESYRRIIHDDGQFTGIEDEVDYVIDNPGYSINPAMICAEIIDKIVW